MTATCTSTLNQCWDQSQNLIVLLSGHWWPRFHFLTLFDDSHLHLSLSWLWSFTTQQVNSCYKSKFAAQFRNASRSMALYFVMHTCGFYICLLYSFTSIVEHSILHDLCTSHQFTAQFSNASRSLAPYFVMHTCDFYIWLLYSFTSIVEHSVLHDLCTSHQFAAQFSNASRSLASYFVMHTCDFYICLLYSFTSIVEHSILHDLCTSHQFTQIPTGGDV